MNSLLSTSAYDSLRRHTTAHAYYSQLLAATHNYLHTTFDCPRLLYMCSVCIYLMVYIPVGSPDIHHLVKCTIVVVRKAHHCAQKRMNSLFSVSDVVALSHCLQLTTTPYDCCTWCWPVCNFSQLQVWNQSRRPEQSWRLTSTTHLLLLHSVPIVLLFTVTKLFNGATYDTVDICQLDFL